MNQTPAYRRKDFWAANLAIAIVITFLLLPVILIGAVVTKKAHRRSGR